MFKLFQNEFFLLFKANLMFICKKRKYLTIVSGDKYSSEI